MENLFLIAAIGKNNELGKDNNLIWHLKEDLKYFKKMTTGKTIIMGRKCFESLPGLLPNRKHIILTNNKDYMVPGATIMHDTSEVLEYVKNTSEECFIIGGAKIYEEFLPYASVLYLTEIDAEADADVYFPKFDKELYDKEVLEKLNDNNISYAFTVYKKKKGKLIIVEGTDCSGKETQTRRLVERLEKENKRVIRLSFPMYDTPTGEIIAACLLGKPEYAKKLLNREHGLFPEGGGNVDPLAATLFYAADRRYNLPIIMKYLNDGYLVLIDRYVTSNMAHRGGLIENKDERIRMYNKIDTLEYDIIELPRPDKQILLYLPYEYALILKKGRSEAPDEVESNALYLQRGEKAYLELAEMYNYDVINCVKDDKIRTIEEINDDLYTIIKNML